MLRPARIRRNWQIEEKRPEDGGEQRVNAAEVIEEAAAVGFWIAIEGDGLSLEASAATKAIFDLIAVA